MTMRYCPVNESLSVPWAHHGFNVCFFDTTTVSLVATWTLLVGTVQVYFYRKHATRLAAGILPRKLLFRAQIFFHLGLISLALLSPAIRHGISPEEEFYGFELLDLILGSLIWLMCIVLILVERHYQLPASPGHGHGAVLIITWTLSLIGVNLDFLSLNNREWFYHLDNSLHITEFIIWVLRYVLTFAVFAIGLKAPGISQSLDYLRGRDDEEALIEESNQSRPGRRSASDGSTWSNFIKKWTTLLPYMWPKKSVALQLRVLICLILLIGVRIANVFVPIFYKKIVDALSSTDPVNFCWGLILAYVGLKWLQGGGTGSQGILNNLRSYLWISIQQYTSREIQVGLFQHLHELSLRWHLSRKTGEVLRVMDRGTGSINNLLQYLVFNILPTIVDIIVAVIFFATAFNIWFGLIVLTTMVMYLGMTIAVTEWRTKYRRSMNLADNEQRTKAVDSLINFETVKYYGAEEFEIKRYREAIETYQKEEWKALASLTLLNFMQSIVMNGGLLAGAMYCGYLVSNGTLTVGDFVLFGTYIMQLMVPLNWLGSLYRFVQESLVDMENMLDLFDEQADLQECSKSLIPISMSKMITCVHHQDNPNAIPIVATKGEVEFRNVNFSYVPERPILKDISFAAKSGETIALVGPTGSGKSTIVRLLFRFYDVNDGAVLIDGQDVRDVTQASIRSSIGVVPQDTVLFNDTIRYNIQYGQLGAPGGSVEEAAAHADIHSRILTFPEGYETKVGERGLKLSGGEKQRVAIARTLLKNPLIVLLDEATSALDTNTERNIQKALNEVCRGRTTIVVAHRLSTVTHADCILVLKEGEIVERGRHDELLQQEGEYYRMWNQQSTANEESSDTAPEVDEVQLVEDAVKNGARPKHKRALNS